MYSIMEKRAEKFPTVAFCFGFRNSGLPDKGNALNFRRRFYYAHLFGEKVFGRFFVARSMENILCTHSV
jgi:hypothetical protein